MRHDGVDVVKRAVELYRSEFRGERREMGLPTCFIALCITAIKQTDERNE